MSEKTPLERARERRQEILSSGQKIERLDPIAKAASKPTSLRLAINAKCYDCQGRDGDPGWRARIGECHITKCPLHAVRPYQRGSDDDEEPGA